MKSYWFHVFRKIVGAFAGRGLALRKIPGLMAAYRRVYQTLCPGGIVLVNVHNYKMYVNTEDTVLAPPLITIGTYEAAETEVFRSVVGPGDTVLDLGANIGYYTLLASQLVKQRGKVFAFEPDPRNYTLLSKNIAINGCGNTQALQIALSNRIGMTKFYLDRRFTGNSSLSERNITENGGYVEVATDTLDHLFESGGLGSRIDVIKMDVQGAEGLVVEGAQKVVASHNLSIIMEFEPDRLRNMGTEPWELLQRLRRLGYVSEAIDMENNCLRSLDAADILRLCEKGVCMNILLKKNRITVSL